jgi:hypothetical protein
MNKIEAALRPHLRARPRSQPPDTPKAIGRPKSTVSRELSRNKLPSLWHFGHVRRKSTRDVGTSECFDETPLAATH